MVGLSHRRRTPSTREPEARAEIAAEKNSTIIFPLPIDLLQLLRHATESKDRSESA